MSEAKIERRKKILQGIVVSNKMDKTAVVSVRRQVQHPLYKRTVVKLKKYKIHDSNNECNVGDNVRLIECRPISRHKRWNLLEIVKKAI